MLIGPLRSVTTLRIMLNLGWMDFLPSGTDAFLDREKLCRVHFAFAQQSQRPDFLFTEALLDTPERRFSLTALLKSLLFR